MASKITNLRFNSFYFLKIRAGFLSGKVVYLKVIYELLYEFTCRVFSIYTSGKLKLGKNIKIIQMTFRQLNRNSLDGEFFDCQQIFAVEFFKLLDVFRQIKVIVRGR